MFEQVLFEAVDAVATCLADAAADAFVSEDDRGEVAGAFDGLSGSIDLGVDLDELDGVITGGVTFIDAKLASLAICVRQAGVLIDDGEAHASDFLLGEWQGTDGTGGANLAAGVAA